MAAHPPQAKRSAGAVGRDTAFKLATLVLALALSLGAAEIGLRALGYTPWRNAPYPQVPLMHTPDSELGWRNEPAEFVFGEEATIHMTFWPGGFRATAPQRTPRPDPILLVGGSFTQGWAVSDSETFGYQLQDAFPSTEVLNLGTGGYGTYQSLLSLERFLEDSDTSPSLVIYGFAFFHQQRNVATHDWLKMLSSVAELDAVHVPYVSLGSDGRLQRNSPVSYPDWPLKRRLASVALLQDAYARLASRKRSTQTTEITLQLLMEMAKLARGAGSDFLVVWLSDGSGSSPRLKRAYLDFLQGMRIRNVDCTGYGTGPQFRVPTYGHPNARVNAYWAQCIERAIRP